MPIITIQRRMAEQGRIRLGHKVGDKGRPEKLSTFRFTSANQRLIEEIAELYGGQAKPWDNDGKPEFEVLTEARSIPVIVIKGGFSQWMEEWSRGGCARRCDGVTEQISQRPCLCAEQGREVCKPTTRLSVMLRDVETLGTFRMESKGWNAAAELPSMAELAMQFGDLVPATLHLVERKAIRDGKTSRFVVPVLDLAVSKQRLVEIAGQQAGGAPAPQIAGPASGVAAIEAAPSAPDYMAQLAHADVARCRQIWEEAGRSGWLTDDLKAAITAHVAHLEEVADEAGESGWPTTESDDPAHINSGDLDDLWMQLVMEAGKHGLSDPQLREALEQEYAQPVEDLDGEQMTAFLAKLKAGEVTA